MADTSIYGITVSDFYDGTVKDLLSILIATTASYIKDRLDPEIRDLAQTLGIYDSTLIVLDSTTNKLHYGINKWAVAWLSKTIFLDYTGQADDMAQDKYLVKYEQYRREEAALRNNVTKEMFLDTVADDDDRSAFSGIIIRG